MNYAIGYALSVNDIFMKFSGKRMKMTAKECEAVMKNRHKDVIAKRVFREAIRLVIEDIIENNNTFVLPTRSKKASIYMKKFSGDSFRKGRSLGKWKKVDFYESLFTGYQLFFKYDKGKIPLEKPIYLDPRHRDRIDVLTSQGKQYY